MQADTQTIENRVQDDFKRAGRIIHNIDNLSRMVPLHDSPHVHMGAPELRITRTCMIIAADLAAFANSNSK